jgi:hypothetical protein
VEQKSLLQAIEEMMANMYCQTGRPAETILAGSPARLTAELGASGMMRPNKDGSPMIVTQLMGLDIIPSATLPDNVFVINGPKQISVTVIGKGSATLDRSKLWFHDIEPGHTAWDSIIRVAIEMIEDNYREKQSV